MTDRAAAALALAERMASKVGGAVAPAVATAKVKVDASGWKSALGAAKTEGFVHFSFLSAIDWSNQPGQGEPVAEEVEERFEVICGVSDVTRGELVVFSTDLPKDGAALDSIVEVYAGANWHEREAAEMFGIDFPGHPDLRNLYLPDGFIGRPLLKSYALMAREVKPWPGTVEVEGLGPSTENPEA